MERPYEKVPLIAMIILIQEYSKLVKDNFKMQKDLDKMQDELNRRFAKPEENRQITIEEYMRSRKNEGK